MSDRRFAKFRRDSSAYRQRLRSCVSDAWMQMLYLSGLSISKIRTAQMDHKFKLSFTSPHRDCAVCVHSNVDGRKDTSSVASGRLRRVDPARILSSSNRC